jgi:hypothetical protein
MVKLIHLFPETTRALCIFILPQFLTLNFFSQFLRKFLLSISSLNVSNLAPDRHQHKHRQSSTALSSHKRFYHRSLFRR